MGDTRDLSPGLGNNPLADNSRRSRSLASFSRYSLSCCCEEVRPGAASLPRSDRRGLDGVSYAAATGTVSVGMIHSLSWRAGGGLSSTGRVSVVLMASGEITGASRGVVGRGLERGLEWRSIIASRAMAVAFGVAVAGAGEIEVGPGTTPPSLTAIKDSFWAVRNNGSAALWLARRIGKQNWRVVEGEVEEAV